MGKASSFPAPPECMQKMSKSGSRRSREDRRSQNRVMAAQRPRIRRKKARRATGHSRFKFIANVESFCWIHLSPFAGPEVHCRSWFFNTFLSADQDWIKEREYLESIKCLDCAAQKHSRDLR